MGAVQYDFGAGRAPVIERYTVTSADDVPERDPRDWQFQGSNEGTNWTTLDTQNGQTFPARYYEMEYAVAKPAAYRFYRMNITANSGANALQVADIKLLSDEPIPNAPVSPSSTGGPTTRPTANVPSRARKPPNPGNEISALNWMKA